MERENVFNADDKRNCTNIKGSQYTLWVKPLYSEGWVLFGGLWKHVNLVCKHVLQSSHTFVLKCLFLFIIIYVCIISQLSVKVFQMHVNNSMPGTLVWRSSKSYFSTSVKVYLISSVVDMLNIYKWICAAHTKNISKDIPPVPRENTHLWTHHSPASPAAVQDRQAEIPGFARVHAELQAQRIVACSG